MDRTNIDQEDRFCKWLISETRSNHECDPQASFHMQTGLTPKGGKSDAPMPTYKLSAEDADAVVEYLKTLK